MKTSIFLDRFHTIKLCEKGIVAVIKPNLERADPPLSRQSRILYPTRHCLLDRSSLAFFTLELPFSVTHCWNKSSRFWFCTHNKFIIPLVRRWPSAVFRSRDFWSLKWYQIAQAFKLIVVLFLFKQIQTSYSSLSKL